MLDIGVTKLAILGAIALVVIGPERLPSVARTVGTLLGRARSYMADVKAEVDRTMDMEELKKMKDSVAQAARDVEQSIQTSASDFEKSFSETTDTALPPSEVAYPSYRHPNKHWRTRQKAMPNWYKVRTGVRTQVLSGAARVARFRPTKFH